LNRAIVLTKHACRTAITLRATSGPEGSRTLDALLARQCSIPMAGPKNFAARKGIEPSFGS